MSDFADRNYEFLLFFIILTFIITTTSGIAYAGDIQKNGHFPVQWGKDAVPFYVKEKPASVPDFIKLLKAPWKDIDGSDFNLEIEYREGSALKKKMITSCNDIMSVRLKNVSKITNSDIMFNNLIGWQSQCQAMKRIAQMMPSENSYIQSDVKSLLGDLAKIRIESSNKQYQLYFKELQSIKEMECKRKDTCVITTENEIQKIQVVALGDYNRDGIQDAIIIAVSGPVDGNANLFIGLIVTKVNQNGEMKIVDWWPN